MARKAQKKYDEDEIEELEGEDEGEEEEDEEGEDEEQEEEVSPIKSKKKLKKSKVRYFPKVVSLEEMQNEIYISGQENINQGKEILLKLDKLLNSVE